MRKASLTAFQTHIREREGLVNRVYADSMGILTFGYGHRVLADSGLEEGDPVPTDTVDKFFAQDSEKAWRNAKKQAKELGLESDNVLVEGLASVSFQLGDNWNKIHKNTWNLMQQGEWDAAAVEAADSEWNEQTPIRVADFQDSLRSMNGEFDRNTTELSPNASITMERLQSTFDKINRENGFDEDQAPEDEAVPAVESPDLSQETSSVPTGTPEEPSLWDQAVDFGGEIVESGKKFLGSRREDR